jgi:UDP-N-acetylmuramoyl-tripeptide--D-alanyl-D-alanine ligase
MSTPLKKSFLDWPLDAAVAALGSAAEIQVRGALSGAIKSVVTDSRVVGPGDVFVALRGDRFDAHEFIAQVVAQGAIAVVVDRPVDADCVQLIVKDTRAALGLLAAAWRKQFDIPVVAVTGSNGKTTTKEMIASILRAQCGADAVLATRGNLNNDVGVPHTLFELNAVHQMAVVEMGMNHRGEIAWLAGLVKPTVALVNNAQREHQEFMETVEAVAAENGSVLEVLPASGVAVYPAFDIHTPLWADLASDARSLTFGLACDALATAQSTVEVLQSGALTTVALKGPWGSLQIDLHVVGEHNALNALAAANCAWAAGCSVEAITAGLVGFRPVDGRMQTLPNPFGGVLINDAYNANPDSVEAAVRALAALPQPSLLVLGDMGEVGHQGEQFHADLGRYAKSHGIAKLFTLGTLAQFSAESFGADAHHFSSIEALSAALLETLQTTHYSVLIKGSRFMKMERAVEAIVKKDVSRGGIHAA